MKNKCLNNLIFFSIIKYYVGSNTLTTIVYIFFKIFIINVRDENVKKKNTLIFEILKEVLRNINSTSTMRTFFALCIIILMHDCIVFRLIKFNMFKI